MQERRCKRRRRCRRAAPRTLQGGSSRMMSAELAKGCRLQRSEGCLGPAMRWFCHQCPGPQAVQGQSRKLPTTTVFRALLVVAFERTLSARWVYCKCNSFVCACTRSCWGIACISAWNRGPRPPPCWHGRQGGPAVPGGHLGPLCRGECATASGGGEPACVFNTSWGSGPDARPTQRPGSPRRVWEPNCEA